MGLFDTLLGRTKPVQADLDNLFGLPSAAVTLQTAGGLTPSGRAGVCYKPPTGQAFEDMQREVTALLSMDGGGTLASAEDTYGYHWVVLENPDVGELVNQVHVVNSSLADAGWGPQLLCSVFGFCPLPKDAPQLGMGDDLDADGGLATPVSVSASTIYLVYLFKRGTFYPFAPAGHERRNTEAELKLKSLVANDLRVEAELDRWFPLWDLPVG